MPRNKPPRRKSVRDPYRPLIQRMVGAGNAIAEAAVGFTRFAHAEADQPLIAAAEEAFKAGASMMFQTMIRMADDTPETMVTTADLSRMELLHNETMAIDRALFAKYGKPAGSA